MGMPQLPAGYVRDELKRVLDMISGVLVHIPDVHRGDPLQRAVEILRSVHGQAELAFSGANQRDPPEPSALIARLETEIIAELDFMAKQRKHTGVSPLYSAANVKTLSKALGHLRSKET